MCVTWLVRRRSWCARRMEGHSKRVTAIAVSPDGRNVYSSSLDNTVKQWNASTGAVRAVAVAMLCV